MTVTVTRAAQWQEQALCCGIGSEAFFPASEVGATAAYRQAARVCRRCPVVQECLQFALEQEADSPAKCRAGVYGGLTPVQRHALHLTRRTAATQTGGAR
jgi:WhiB family redox-sensing transcriptional regulator